MHDAQPRLALADADRVNQLGAEGARVRQGGD